MGDRLWFAETKSRSRPVRVVTSCKNFWVNIMHGNSYSAASTTGRPSTAGAEAKTSLTTKKAIPFYSIFF